MNLWTSWRTWKVKNQNKVYQSVCFVEMTTVNQAWAYVKKIGKLDKNSNNKSQVLINAYRILWELFDAKTIY